MMVDNTKIGPVIIVLLIALVAFGYLLSDNLTLNTEIAAASAQQRTALEQIQQLEYQRVSLEQELNRVSAEQERLNLELQIRSIEVQLLQQQNDLSQLSGEKMTVRGRIVLTGYVEYKETNLGKVVLTYPQSISLGDSDVVILTLIPNTVVYSDSARSSLGENSAMLSIDLPDDVEISPIMKAKISGVGFEIMENANEQAVNPDKPTEWIWTVSGKEEGKHILVANISVPMTIDGNPEEVNTNMHLYPVEIEVLKPLKSRLSALIPYILPAVTAGIVSFFVGMFVNARKQKGAGLIVEENVGGYVKLSKDEREAIIKMRRKP
jgi:hypothetical protein